MDKLKKFSVLKKSYREAVLDKAIESLSNDDYELVKKIGRGSFGNVIALKKTFFIEDEGGKLKVVTEEFAGKVVLQDMTSLGEFTEWHSFDHPNVLPLFAIFRQPEFNMFLTPIHEESLYSILKEK